MSAVPNTVSVEVQDFIQQLLENESYDEDSIYDFIEEHGEQNFMNYYEEYVRFGEEGSYDAVDAFVDSFGIDSISDFDESYQGQWDSEEDFVENFLLDCFDLSIPDFVVIDYKNTWESNLRHDFVFNDGFVFNRNF